jgi:hypothetical protein
VPGADVVAVAAIAGADVEAVVFAEREHAAVVILLRLAEANQDLLAAHVDYVGIFGYFERCDDRLELVVDIIGGVPIGRVVHEDPRVLRVVRMKGEAQEAVLATCRGRSDDLVVEIEERADRLAAEVEDRDLTRTHRHEQARLVARRVGDEDRKRQVGAQRGEGERDRIRSRALLAEVGRGRRCDAGELVTG